MLRGLKDSRSIKAKASKKKTTPSVLQVIIFLGFFINQKGVLKTSRKS
jgi:hypothetical protein